MRSLKIRVVSYLTHKRAFSFMSFTDLTHRRAFRLSTFVDIALVLLVQRLLQTSFVRTFSLLSFKFVTFFASNLLEFQRKTCLLQVLFCTSMLKDIFTFPRVAEK